MQTKTSSRENYPQLLKKFLYNGTIGCSTHYSKFTPTIFPFQNFKIDFIRYCYTIKLIIPQFLRISVSQNCLFFSSIYNVVDRERENRALFVAYPKNFYPKLRELLFEFQMIRSKFKYFHKIR